ncbi:hypothetical protein OAE36_00205 [bacterium]|jgi:hypothetical protein|nr:hypothetical protein [bacterium]
MTDVAGNGMGSNSPVENIAACVEKQARRTSPLTALINTHHNYPPPSRNHSTDLSRTSTITMHGIPLATLARENQ